MVQRRNTYKSSIREDWRSYMKKMRAEFREKKNGVDGPGIEMRGKEEWESAVGSSNGGCN